MREVDRFAGNNFSREHFFGGRGKGMMTDDQVFCQNRYTSDMAVASILQPHLPLKISHPNNG